MRVIRLGVALGFAAVLFAAGAASANSVVSNGARGGTLDPTFGVAGKVVVTLAAGSIGGVVVQPDGKLVVAVGPSWVTRAAPCLVRFFPNGALDRSFGGNGVAPIVVAELRGTPTPLALALQPDGKLIVGGRGYEPDSRTFLARFDGSGRPDGTFGIRGAVTDVVPVALRVVLLGPRGDILAGGGGGPDDAVTAVAHLTPDGRFDARFGGGGRAIAFGSVGSVSGIGLQNDGKLLLLGAGGVVRLRADGSLDTTLGGGTLVAIAHANPGALLRDGRFLTTTMIESASVDDAYDVAAIRHFRDGRRDFSFAATAFGFIDGAANAPTMVALDGTNRVLVLGSAERGGIDVAGLARLTTAGRLDTTFGNRGRLVLSFGSDFTAPGVLALQPDGRIVVATIARSGRFPATLLAVARYLPS